MHWLKWLSVSLTPGRYFSRSHVKHVKSPAYRMRHECKTSRQACKISPIKENITLYLFIYFLFFFFHACHFKDDRSFNFGQQMAVLQNQCSGGWMARKLWTKRARYLCARFARFATNPTHAPKIYAQSFREVPRNKKIVWKLYRDLPNQEPSVEQLFYVYFYGAQKVDFSNISHW